MTWPWPRSCSRSSTPLVRPRPPDRASPRATKKAGDFPARQRSAQCRARPPATTDPLPPPQQPPGDHLNAGPLALAPARVASIISRVNDHQPRMDRATSCPTGPAAVFRGVDLATSRSGATVAWRVGRRDLPTVLAGTGIAATGIHAPGVRTIHGDRGSARVSTATAVPVGRVFGPAPGRRTRKFLRSIVEADQATWATASQRREDPRSTAAVLRPRTGRADGAAGRARPSQFGVSAVCRRHRSGRHRGPSRCVLPPRSHTAPQQDSTVRRRQRSPRVRTSPQQGHVRIVQRDPNSPVSVNFRAISLSFTLSP